MTPQIETLREKRLAGLRLTMSVAHNRTGELWKNFMSRRHKITNRVSGELISLQVYPPAYFAHFQPDRPFEKWAAVEVTGFDAVPDDMETFTLPAGLYAVFHYKGSSNDTRIFDYIFNTWLPGSNYQLDDRPHFEILGDRYKNNDPASEEEIWIPIQPKA